MKVPSEHNTEREGVAKVNLIFSKDLGWLFREQPTSDFGIDAHVEVVVDDQSTGRLIALQIKSGASYVKHHNEETITYYGDRAHLDYWLEHSLPVVILLYDPLKETVYWQSVSRATVQTAKTGWKLAIPYSHVLGADSAAELRVLAEGTRYDLELRRMQLHRPWMEMLREGDRVFLEVEEWLNKVSGRGDFRLVVQDSDGNEREEQNWPFQLLGGTPYEELLPRLFPWADMSIDEGTYESHDEARWREDAGIWDKEDLEYVMFESFDDWLETQRSGLRPYSEGEEIANWRLELSLGPVAEAFLTLDDFLREQAGE